MTKAPGTVDFMPPEALADSENIRYDRTLDVFSFGCVMLHTLSHQWPTPSEPVVTDPETGLVTRGRSEVERRSRYFSKLDQSQFGTLIPLIEGCLSNLPKNRISIMRICQELEGLVDSERINNFTVLALQEEIQRKDVEVQNKNAQIQHQATELHSKDVEIATLRSELSSIQMTALQSQSRKVKCMIYKYESLTIYSQDKFVFFRSTKAAQISGIGLSYRGGNVLTCLRNSESLLLLN